MADFLNVLVLSWLKTERAGFEPAIRDKANTGFRNQLDQLLRHLSIDSIISCSPVLFLLADNEQKLGDTGLEPVTR